MNLVYDPTPLKKHLHDNTIIKNLGGSSLRFHLADGTVSLLGAPSANALPWAPLLEHKEIHTLKLKNCNSELLYQLPSNVQTLTLEEYKDLGRVAGWLHAEHLAPNTRTLQYEGGYSDLVPSFQGRITEDLAHFLLPLTQNLEPLAVENPHLRSFGFDFDHQRDRRILQREDLNFVLWSSSAHNHYLGKTHYPRHEHRLHRPIEEVSVLPWHENMTYFSRL